MLNVFQLGGLGRTGQQSTPGGGGGTGAHRYWQFVNLDIPSGYFEISELQLWVAGARAAGATISSSDVPGLGSVSDLNDDDVMTRCFWTITVAEDPSFFVRFDLGSAQVVTGWRQASFDDSNRYIRGCTVQYSDDGSTWTDAGTFSGISWIGALYTYFAVESF